MTEKKSSTSKAASEMVDIVSSIQDVAKPELEKAHEEKPVKAKTVHVKRHWKNDRKNLLLVETDDHKFYVVKGDALGNLKEGDLKQDELQALMSFESQLGPVNAKLDEMLYKAGIIEVEDFKNQTLVSNFVNQLRFQVSAWVEGAKRK